MIKDKKSCLRVIRGRCVARIIFGLLKLIKFYHCYNVWNCSVLDDLWARGYFMFSICMLFTFPNHISKIQIQIY